MTAILALSSGTGFNGPRLLIVIWLLGSVCFIVVFGVLLAVEWFDERRVGRGHTHPPRG